MHVEMEKKSLERCSLGILCMKSMELHTSYGANRNY